MIEFKRTVLDNGLKVLVHSDKETDLVAFNIAYNVGARDENPEMTGFAHLFEHLMFGGSKNIPDFDTPLQMAGGTNNAFTTNDYTNYYITIPKQHLETAFWLESDRMLSLDFSSESLEVQRKVVIEEFKQRYLNQPYGDIWLELRPLAYKHHPYRWATIGKNIEHIENATLADVESFFKQFYVPNNAVLVVAGNVEAESVFEQAQKWFGEIPRGNQPLKNFPQEPISSQADLLRLERKVPQSSHYLAWHMPGRLSPHYPSIDLISDILGRGQSSRLYRTLVNEKSLFTSISSYILGSIDPGLLLISGMLSQESSFKISQEALLRQIDFLCNNEVDEMELQKIKNNHRASHTFENISLLNRAMNLAYYEMLGGAEIVNRIPEEYEAVSAQSIKQAAKLVFGNGDFKELQYVSTQKA